MKKPKWTTEEKRYYKIVTENNTFYGVYDTYEEALKDAQRTDDWHHKGYCYAIALTKTTTNYVDGKFFSSEKETAVVRRLAKEETK